MTLLESLAAPRAPAPGALVVDDLTLSWDDAMVVARDGQGAFSVLLDARREGSLQLSRWTRTAEVPASAWWQRALGGTEPVERHELVVEVRTATRRIRMRADVDDPALLDGLARLDLHTDTRVELEPLRALLCACRVAGARLVRDDVGRAGASSSWLQEEGTDRSSTAPPARERERQHADHTPRAPVEAPHDRDDAPHHDDVSDEVTPVDPLVAVDLPLDIVRVGYGPDDDTRSLHEAFERVSRGGRIEVGPGRFAIGETLDVRHSVTLSGAGASRSTVVSSVLPALRVPSGLAARVELSGLTLTARAPQQAALVSIEAGDVRVTKTTLGPGGRGGGLAAASGASSVRLVDSVVTGNGGHGVHIEGVCSLLVSSGVIERNEGDGVRVGAASSGRIEQLRARHNGGAGVTVEGSANAVVTGCTASHNTVGVSVRHAARVTIDHCECMRNRESGIVLRDAASGRVHDNRCIDNPHAILQQDAAGSWVISNNITG